MGFLQIDNVTKSYDAGEAPCVDGLSLSLDEGSIVVLLGESGCGKSTLLKMVAGLEQADSGAISVDGSPLEGIPPEKRPVAMVFQKALLFKNMTVEQNVNFAPRVNRTMGKAELAEKTAEMLELVGLSGLGSKKATELSGGQEQRVSLARALMVEPKLLLLDEPLSALDATLRETMQKHIRSINRQTGVTMLMVTHDQREAVAVADRIAVMHDGRIEQYDAPEVFYRRPATRYVASFFGWRNLLPARIENGRIESALGSLPVPQGCATSGAGTLAIRPEAAMNVGCGSIAAELGSATCEGVTMRCSLALEDGTALELSLPADKVTKVGDELTFDIDSTCIWFIGDEDDATQEDVTE